MSEGILGELAPAVESMRPYRQAVVVKLPYEEIVEDPFQTPEEAQIWFDVGGVRKNAFVPLTVVDKDAGMVSALVIGERGCEALIVFPPTNFGETRLYLDAKALQDFVYAPKEENGI